MTFTIKIFVMAVLMKNILAGHLAPTGEKQAQQIGSYAYSRSQESYFGEANGNTGNDLFQSQGLQSQGAQGAQGTGGSGVILSLPVQTSQMSWTQTQYQAFQPASAVESVEKETQVYQKPSAVQAEILAVQQQPLVENQKLKPVLVTEVIELQKPVLEKELIVEEKKEKEVLEYSASEKKSSK